MGFIKISDISNVSVPQNSDSANSPYIANKEVAEPKIDKFSGKGVMVVTWEPSGPVEKKNVREEDGSKTQYNKVF